MFFSDLTIAIEPGTPGKANSEPNTNSKTDSGTGTKNNSRRNSRDEKKLKIELNTSPPEKNKTEKTEKIEK